MRVIFDTNILISALINPAGRCGNLYGAWRSSPAELFTCEEQLTELRRVSRYPAVRRYVLPAQAGTLINELRTKALFVVRLPKVDFPPDPNDAYLLSLSIAGHVEYLVTGDRSHLLSLGRFGTTQIVTADQMLEILS